MANTPRVVTGTYEDTTGRLITQDYQAKDYAASIALVPTSQFTCINVAELTGALTLTCGVGTSGTAPYIGDKMDIIFVADATGRTVTFSTGFGGITTLAVGSSAKAIASFVFNGSAWVFVSSGTYASYAAENLAPAYSATLTMAPTGRIVTFQPAQLTGALTINATVTGSVAGDILYMSFVADGTNRVVTFGTNFKSSGTLTVTASKWAGATAVFNGTYWVLVGREISA